MVLKNILKENCYYDSVTLMLISSSLKEIEGVEDAAVMMTTEMNINILEAAGLLLPEFKKVSANSMLIAVKSLEGLEEKVVEIIEKKLNEKNKNSGTLRSKTIDNAMTRLDEINLSIVSIPGRYAKNEVMNLLKKGVHVMLFSDNVTIEDELELKEFAVSKELLMMGPDCGTAIINGIPLGFANVVNRGNIGMVAASGTGLQEVSSIISNNGGGISQALGTGGRDLKEKIGGLMMMQCLEALESDQGSEIITVVSKPAAPLVAEKIINQLLKSSKKSVYCVLGGNEKKVIEEKIHVVSTLEEAAIKSLELVGITIEPKDRNSEEKIVNEEVTLLRKNNTANYVRGLFSGGTLCYEAMLIYGDCYSNIASNKEFQLKDVEVSFRDTLIDMGEDYFTDGRPHPMINQSLRLERLKSEIKDTSVGVILLDSVLGYGSNMNTTKELADTIAIAKKDLKKQNQHITFIASICGTEEDPQKRSEQIKYLEEAGVIVFDTNAQAAAMASAIVAKLR